MTSISYFLWCALGSPPAGCMGLSHPSMGAPCASAASPQLAALTSPARAAQGDQAAVRLHQRQRAPVWLPAALLPRAVRRHRWVARLRVAQCHWRVARRRVAQCHGRVTRRVWGRRGVAAAWHAAPPPRGAARCSTRPAASPALRPHPLLRPRRRLSPPGASSWVALATVVDSPGTALAAMMLGALSTAASDVVVDSIVVERARGAPEVRAVLCCAPV